jgi:chromosome segregation ATPase
MKTAGVVSLSLFAGASASQGSPIGKVIEMIQGLEAKVIAEGDAAQKAYEEVAEFCSDRQKEMAFEVETGKSYSGELKATISEAAADIEEDDAKVADLSASIAKSDKELQEAKALRKQENAAFTTAENDLVTTVDTLERASGIISRNMNKGSFAQLQGVQGLTSALKILVEGSAINVADGNKLTALIQSYSNDDQDEESGAPGAATYENQSGGILDLLADLQSKAEDELSSLRDAESQAQHNFDLKAQALADALKFANVELDETKKSKAALEEKKAGAEADLAGTQKDLFGDTSTLGELHRDCQAKAADFEAETSTRGEELKALATARNIIKEATGAASFLQIAQAASAQSGSAEAVRKVRELAVAEKSTRLARLASRMEALLQRHGANPFGKVTGMIKDMIAKLEAEAESSASQKAFCDKALAENNEKKDDATAEIQKLSVKMEQGAAASAALKEQVTTLQAELAALMKAQQDMDRLRAEEHALFETANAEQTKGLTGIQAALKVLRDYYAQNADSGSQGAAGGIVSLLEVCESDFTKSLAELNTVEEDAAATYKSETKDNELTKLTKDKDVEYKQKEIASLAKAGTELKTDRDAVQDELDSVMASLASLEKQCLAKAESYESKVAKQKKEIDGLKSALESLGGASLLQRSRHLRHTMVHA